jgi:hypothetical protein
MSRAITVKQLFFDRAVVIAEMESKTRKALSRAGAFIRTRARSSIRSRKSAAPVGSPPSSHTHLLKRFIFFSYDPATKSIVAGPEQLTGVRGTDVPHTLEFGGHGQTKGKGGVRRVFTIKPRPFMGPALKKEVEAGTIPQQWGGSLKG